MEINSLSARVGAEVRGVDVKNLSDDDFGQMYQAWLDHCVLVVRGQSLDDNELKAFAERFGPLEERPTGNMSEDEKAAMENLYVTVISNIVKDGKALGGLGNKEASWHSDMTYRPVPPTASLLYAVELPETGGDTHFSSQYAAYEATPLDLLARLEGVEIKHDATHTSVGDLRRGFEEISDPRVIPGAAHPPIRKHGETGRNCLYLGRRDHAYVLDHSMEESEQLLDEAWQYAALPEACYTHVWSLGDVVIWDNRAVLHRRDGFDESARRMMRRCQVLERDTEAA
jgi:taurine dioxygenase